MKRISESLNQFKDKRFFGMLKEQQEEISPTEEEKLSPEEKKKLAIQLEKEGNSVIRKINDNFKRFKTVAGSKLQSYRDFWKEQETAPETIGVKGTFYNLYDSHYIVGVTKGEDEKAQLVVWNTDIQDKKDYETFVCKNKNVVKEFMNFYKNVLEATMKEVITNHKAALEAKKAAEEARKKEETAAAKKASLDKFLSESKKKVNESHKPWNCPKCGNMTSHIGSHIGAGVCKDCEDAGFWIDPAGGLHNDEGDSNYDPASMYEQAVGDIKGLEVQIDESGNKLKYRYYGDADLKEAEIQKDTKGEAYFKTPEGEQYFLKDFSNNPINEDNKLNEWGDSYDDFIDNYASELKDATIVLKKISEKVESGEIDEAQLNEVLDKIENIYDQEVFNVVESALFGGYIPTIRELANIGLDILNRHGTEMKMIINAIDDLSGYLGVFAEEDEEGEVYNKDWYDTE